MNATHAKALFLWALLFFCLKTGLIHAQGVCDSTRVISAEVKLRAEASRTQAPRKTVIRPQLDSLRAACRSTVPTPSTNQRPTAAFTVSAADTLYTFDGRGSTDDRAVVSWTWRTTDGRVEKTGSVMTRVVRRHNAPYTEWLIVRDSAGLTDSISRLIQPPPPVGSPPPPAPVVLPTPVSIAPGSTSVPGPVAGLTPVFSWQAVSGATGYIVAIRDVGTGAFVYPSSTGVGVPIAGTSLVLPPGTLIAGGSYRWDVTAVSASGKSAASADRYFTTPPTTPPPPSPGSPELPRSEPTHADPYPGRACDIQVASGLGSNLQAALQQAVAMTGPRVVCLANTVTSTVVQFPARAAGDNAWIIVRAVSVSTPFGTRVTPSPGMPRLQTSVNGESFSFAPGTHHWYIEGLEFTIGPSVTLTYALMDIGTLTATTVAQQPSHIILRGNWIHGSATATVRRCVSVNSASTAIIDNHIDDCHDNGSDSQAIFGANGPGPYLIENNYLAGAGENIMFGGADPKIPGLVPSDITIRRNFVHKPIAKKGVWLVVKNLLETKNAVRVLIEGNVFDGSWASAQGGMAILLRSINQEGACRWCRTTDLTFRRNLIRNSGGGIGITAGWAATDTTSRRILVSENAFDQLGIAPYTGANAPALHLSGPGQSQDIVFERTIVTGTVFQGVRLDNTAPAIRAVFRDLVIPRGQFGSGSDGQFEGTAGLQAGAPGMVWTGVHIIGPSRTDYPPGTIWIANESAAPLTAQIRAIVTQATAGVVITP